MYLYVGTFSLLTLGATRKLMVYFKLHAATLYSSTAPRNFINLQLNHSLLEEKKKYLT